MQLCSISDWYAVSFFLRIFDVSSSTPGYWPINRRFSCLFFSTYPITIMGGSSSSRPTLTQVYRWVCGAYSKLVGKGLFLFCHYMNRITGCDSDVEILRLRVLLAGCSCGESVIYGIHQIKVNCQTSVQKFNFTITLFSNLLVNISCLTLCQHISSLQFIIPFITLFCRESP